MDSSIHSATKSIIGDRTNIIMIMTNYSPKLSYQYSPKSVDLPLII